MPKSLTLWLIKTKSGDRLNALLANKFNALNNYHYFAYSNSLHSIVDPQLLH